MITNCLKILSALAICTAMMSIFAPPSFAQGPTSQDVDRAQLLQGQTQPPFGPGVTPGGIEDGHAAASPNDADIGQQEILKRVTGYQPFTASLASPIFYTSNVALTRSGEKSDVVIAPVAGVFYDPRITNTLYVDDRLGDEFFSNHGLIFNAELPFRFSRAQQLSIGGDTNISVGADHQRPRRNDYEGYLGYSVNLTRAFTINAVGRVVARDYHQNGRTDVSEILSATATYRLTNWWSVSAISSFAHSDSNQDVFDYNVANVGGAIALSAKF